MQQHNTHLIWNKQINLNFVLNTIAFAALLPWLQFFRPDSQVLSTSACGFFSTCLTWQLAQPFCCLGCPQPPLPSCLRPSSDALQLPGWCLVFFSCSNSSSIIILLWLCAWDSFFFHLHSRSILYLTLADVTEDRSSGVRGTLVKPPCMDT